MGSHLDKNKKKKKKRISLLIPDMEDVNNTTNPLDFYELSPNKNYA